MHPTNIMVSNTGLVTITAKSIGGITLPDYTGTITLSEEIVSPTIRWRNNTGNGTFTDNSDGTATYVFDTTDNGIVQVYISNSVVESNNLEVFETADTNLRDNDAEPYLSWIYGKPYIISINPVLNNSVNAGALSRIEILFSTVIDTNYVGGSAVPSYKVYREMPNLVVISNSWITSTNILEEFQLIISTNLYTSFGEKFEDGPNIKFSSFGIAGSYRTMVTVATGGTVTFNDTTLIVEPGDLPADSWFTYDDTLVSSSIQSIAQANINMENNQFMESIDNYEEYFRITAVDGQTNSYTEFALPVEIQFEYDKSAIIASGVIEENLSLFYLDTSNPSYPVWRPIESTVDVTNGLVIADISKAGVYTIMLSSQSFTFMESFLTYPNPAILGIDEITIKFYLEQDALVTLEVFTIDGERVATIMSEESFNGGILYDYETAPKWDGRNDIGMNVKSGVYIIRGRVQYQDGSTEEILWKQAVIR